jgi:hypothetical protein
MRGMFADLAPNRSLVDELIAERRAEARLEDREDRRRLGNARRRQKKQPRKCRFERDYDPLYVNKR